MPLNTKITEHRQTSDRHTTFYLAAGPEGGPLLIFLHGWPELSLSWRHQLPTFAALGFRCVAPDMRGYGRSSVPTTHADYAQRELVGDMIELLDSLSQEKAVWIGHDWGSPVAWNLASHHLERCHAVASLCVPYRTIELGLDAILPLIDRRTYPEADFPVGQWEYMKFYEENFEIATRGFEANPYNTAKLLFRSGNPAGRGNPSLTAHVRNNGGWFGPENVAPDIPRDPMVLSEEDLLVYAAAMEKSGFLVPTVIT